MFLLLAPEFTAKTNQLTQSRQPKRTSLGRYSVLHLIGAALSIPLDYFLRRSGLVFGLTGFLRSTVDSRRRRWLA